MSDLRKARGAPSRRSRSLAVLRAAFTASTIILAARSALALYGGHEEDFRRFTIGREFFLDEVSLQPLPSFGEDWMEADVRPGGARGWRLACGSLNTYDALMRQELRLAYPFRSPWSWSFRYEQGDWPDGRYERTWTGLRYALGSGWSAGLSITPEGDKEFMDLALAAGREELAGERVRLRWEMRVIFTDRWYDAKNSENASFDWTPLDLQLSLLASWGAGSWLSIELDRDLPFRKTYLDNPAAAPDDRNYVFSFDRFEATARGSFKVSPADTLLARLVVYSSDRSRAYFGGGDPAGDWDAADDLWIADLAWWRRLDERNEIAFGYELVDLDESLRRPNDAADPGISRDRMDHIVSLRHRRRLSERVYLTTGLWNDFLDRVTYDLTGGGGSLVTSESKLSFTLESPREPEGLRSARFAVGVFIELDSPGAGGYLQFSALF